MSGCEKKYEEGPLISLRSLEKRLVGKWKLEKYTVDGIDSTSYLQSASCDYFLHIKSAYETGRWSGEYNSGSASICYNIGNQYIEKDFDFEYWDARMKLLSTETTADDNGRIGLLVVQLNSSGDEFYVEPSFYFKKITKKNFILESDDSTSIYRYELSRIE